MASNEDGILRNRVSRRTVLKGATGVAAALCATGIAGKSYERASAQSPAVGSDAWLKQLLSLGQNDLQKVGEMCLFSKKKGKFKGQTVTLQGLNNAGFHVNVMRPASKAWEEYTGAKINWIEVTQGDSYPKMHQAISTNTVNFDILEGSGGWEGDLFSANHTLEMPAEVKAAVDFEDIVPYLQNPVRTWNGKIMGMSIDGDCHHFNYRRDILSDKDLAAEWKKSGGAGEWGPPTTWQQVQAITKFMKGKTYQGQPLYGILDTLAPNGGVSTYFFNSRASAYAKYPGNPAVFFDPADMTPYVNTPPFVRALQDMIDALPGEPPDEKNADLLKTFGDFLAGTGSMLHWWADVGVNEYTNSSSIVQHKVGFSILPGSPDVYNQKTKAWEKYAASGTPAPGSTPGINQAPYLAFLGWGLYVMKEADKRGVSEAAWDLVTHLTGKYISLYMNVHPSGFNPWRKSHFVPEYWTYGGFPIEDAKEYLDSILNSYNHPNRIIDLRIPGLGQYYLEAENAWTRAVAGQTTAQAALDDAAKRWNQITDQLGRQNQIKLYQASLG